MEGVGLKPVLRALIFALGSAVIYIHIHVYSYKLFGLRESFSFYLTGYTSSIMPCHVHVTATDVFNCLVMTVCKKKNKKKTNKQNNNNNLYKCPVCIFRSYIL